MPQEGGMNEFVEILNKYFRMSNDIMILHQGGIIRWANNRFLELTGHSLIEMAGRHCFELIAPEHRALIEERIGRTFSGPDDVNPPVEMKYRGADGRTFWIHTISAPVELDMGPSVLVVGHDITRRKEDEEIIRNMIVKLLPPRLGRLFSMMAEGATREDVMRIMELDNATISRYLRRIRNRVGMPDNEEFFDRVIRFFQ
jgi:PAS domain S-box-containing protein